MGDRLIPFGYVAWTKALSRLGKEMFGDEWTGDETSARAGLYTPEQWTFVRKSGGSGAPVNGHRPECAPLDRHPLSPEYQEERRARERFEKTRTEMHARLERGTAKAAVLFRSKGEIRPLSSEYWRTTLGARAINRGGSHE